MAVRVVGKGETSSWSRNGVRVLSAAYNANGSYGLQNQPKVFSQNGGNEIMQ